MKGQAAPQMPLSAGGRAALTILLFASTTPGSRENHGGHLRRTGDRRGTGRSDHRLRARQGRTQRPRHRAGPGLRRRHQPHGQLQGLPLRHRRPPLLLEIQGGRRPLERDPARRFHRPSPALTHLLQGQVLRLPAQSLRGAAQPRAHGERRLPRLLRAGRGPSRSSTPKPFTSGFATSSASASSPSSSRPTPRRCGAWAATRFQPIGRRSASRG